MKKQTNNPEPYPETTELPSEKRKVREMIEWEIKNRGMINSLYNTGPEVVGHCIPITYLPKEKLHKKYTAQPQDPFENLTDDELWKLT